MLPGQMPGNEKDKVYKIRWIWLILYSGGVGVEGSIITGGGDFAYIGCLWVEFPPAVLSIFSVVAGIR